MAVSLSASVSGCCGRLPSTERSCDMSGCGMNGRVVGLRMLASTWLPKPWTGELWAIQAKAYDPAYAIKKADVDSFLSESARPEFQLPPSDRDDRPDRQDGSSDAGRSREACRSFCSGRSLLLPRSPGQPPPPT